MSQETATYEAREKFNMSDIVVTGITGTRFKEMFEGLSGEASEVATLHDSFAAAVECIANKEAGERPGLIVVLPSSVEQLVDSLPAPTAQDMVALDEDLRTLQGLDQLNFPIKFVTGDTDFHELDLAYMIQHGGQSQGLRWDSIVEELTEDYEHFPEITTD